MKTKIQHQKNTIQTIILTAVVAIGFVISCSPKTTVVAATKEVTPEYLAKGKTIFDNSCKRCHDLPNPTDHSAQDWVGIMNSMAPKARLNAEQHQMVYDYVVSVKK